MRRVISHAGVLPLALRWVSASRSSLPWGDVSVTVSPAKCHRQTMRILQDLSSKQAGQKCPAAVSEPEPCILGILSVMLQTPYPEEVGLMFCTPNTSDHCNRTKHPRRTTTDVTGVTLQSVDSHGTSDQYLSPGDTMNVSGDLGFSQARWKASTSDG